MYIYNWIPGDKPVVYKLQNWILLNGPIQLVDTKKLNVILLKGPGHGIKFKNLDKNG